MLIPARTHRVECLHYLIANDAGAMGNPCRDDRTLSGVQRDGLACDSELNLTGNHQRDLLLGMVMLRKDGPRLVDVPHHRLSFAVYDLTSDARVNLDRR